MAKKALIELERKRLAQVADAEFQVAAGLKWIPCADDATPETHKYDEGTDSVVLIPPLPPSPVPSAVEMNAACVAGIAVAPPPQFGFDLRRAFIAKAISDEAYRLGVAPGALTGAQLTALRNRLAAIYQAL